MRWLVPVAICLLIGVANDTSAQSFGVGGRVSLVRPDARDDAPEAERYWGGFARLRLSDRTALEGSIDYRSLTDAQDRRIRLVPIQGSLLLYPFRSVIGMYLLGGIGRYSERIETPPVSGGEATVVSTARTGYHAGLGGELQLGRHAAFHVDYRYTFLHRGDEIEGSVPGAIPLPGTLWLQEKLNLWHEGSMWTAGLTVYF